MLRCNLRIIQNQSNRFYKFGKVIKEKRIQVVPKDEIDLSMQKIEKDIFKHDFSVIEAQIEMLFDPYKELGLDRNATVSELQKKLRFERKNLDLQIEQLKSQSSSDNSRLQELKSRSNIVDEAILIFSSYSERKRFDDNYAIQVHEIIHSNLTRRQRRKLAIDRFKNSISQKVYEYTPTTIQTRTDMAVKYANNKKKVVLDNISMPHRRATLLFNFIPFCIIYLVLLPIMHDKELEDSVSWKTAEAMYPEHKYYNIHYIYGWWLSVSAFWENQFKRRLWDKYVYGITDTDRIANKLSPVSEFERRDTEIIDLALELEKLTKSKS